MDDFHEPHSADPHSEYNKANVDESEQVKGRIASEVVDEEDEGFPEAPFFMFLYTSLMLLLMTFFIVLVSMATTSSGKFEEAKKSLHTTFDALGLTGSKEALLFLYSVLKIKTSTIEDALSLHNENVKESEPDTTRYSGRSESMFWADGISKEEAIKLDEFISLGFIVTEPSQDQNYLSIKMPGDLLFAGNSYDIMEQAPVLIKRLLLVLGLDFSRLYVKCYTNQMPEKGFSFETPLELSALRAHRVVSLIYEIFPTTEEKHNVFGIGYGPFNPKGTHKDGVDQTLTDDFVEFQIHSVWKEESKDESTPPPPPSNA